MQDISFFLPVRSGSQRVKNKNTRDFAGIKGGILALKLQQLCSASPFKEIILSTNDKDCMDIGYRMQQQDNRIKVIERPQHLCEDTTALTDLIAYVPSVANTCHVLWGHVTTPLANAVHYEAGVRSYFENLSLGFDSLISVQPFRNFLLNDKAEVMNCSAAGIRWPRTQDLIPLFEINHVMFIAPTEIYRAKKDRIGGRPYLFEMDKIHSLDVDWEDDFLIAETVYEKTNGL